MIKKIILWVILVLITGNVKAGDKIEITRPGGEIMSRDLKASLLQYLELISENINYQLIVDKSCDLDRRIKIENEYSNDIYAHLLRVGDYMDRDCHIYIST